MKVLWSWFTLSSTDPQSVESCNLPWPVQADGSPDGEKETDVYPEIWRNREHGGGRHVVFSFCFDLLLYCTDYSTWFCSGAELSARCHYCTHYSSAIIVASFLVRMEPFSHTFKTLQVRTLLWQNVNYKTRKTGLTTSHVTWDDGAFLTSKRV